LNFTLSGAFIPTEQLVPIAQAAEAAGFRAMSFPDHVVHPEKIDTPSPYTPDGKRRWEAFTPWVDPWVAIGALAQATTTLRFTNNIFVLAMRNPFMAAKSIATASVLSGGRVHLTLGVGWSNLEYELMGQSFHNRGKRTDEMIEVLKKLWTGEMVEHQGEFYSFDRLEMTPAPAGPIPIWVGGISDPALRRAARNDGWMSDLQTTAEIAECIAKAREYRAELGREKLPFDVMASASDAGDVDGYRRLGDVGVTHILTMPWAFYHGLTDDLDKKIDGTKRYGEDIIDKMR